MIDQKKEEKKVEQKGIPTGRFTECKNCGKTAEIIILDKAVSTAGIRVPHPCCSLCEERLDK
ncbi:MAG TPA: hypothetical protein P5230_00890 [Candidatus Magasanikbacteria bacterium]|nr:hypothetical protein [Candidatus Magasanikbacteria bacterium]